MADEILSEVIFQNLWTESFNYKRPQVRQQTLTNLKASCDAIEDGTAKPVIEEKKRKKIAGELRINSTNIDAYVRGMEWTGPTRTTCEGKEIKKYVQARESERDKVEIIRPKNKNDDLDIALSQIDTIEVRNYVRKLFEQRRQSDNKYNSLLSGLKQIPAIDVDALLENKQQSKMTVLEAPATAAAGLSLDDISSLKNIYEKLTNNDELRQVGLAFDGENIASVVNGQRLLSAGDLEILRRLSTPVGGK